MALPNEIVTWQYQIYILYVASESTEVSRNALEKGLSFIYCFKLYLFHMWMRTKKKKKILFVLEIFTCFI